MGVVMRWCTNTAVTSRATSGGRGQRGSSVSLPEGRLAYQARSGRANRIIRRIKFIVDIGPSSRPAPNRMAPLGTTKILWAGTR